MYLNGTISGTETVPVTENMDDHVNISITKGFGYNSTSEGLTLQLRFYRTTFDTAFTFMTFTIAFFGVVGNIATIGKIVRDSKYHTPTFAAIALLVLADFQSVTYFSLIRLTNLMTFWNFSSYIASLDFLSSYFHVCLLSALRYLITVHPLQSRQRLTATAVCLCSLTIWITSCLTVILITLVLKNTGNHEIIRLSINILIPFIVCSIIIMLHVKKIKTLRSSMSLTDQTQRRMNIVVSLTITIFVLYHLSIIVGNTLKLTFVNQQSQVLSFKTSKYISYFHIFIGCLNFSCNPYIIFLSQFI
uniref:G-protein coupled receptors family 1 profile domain-containing protein n=1 Tax=Magallana gigas TaxID=29159 RepID=A0A8W8LHA6_MAGGI